MRVVSGLEAIQGVSRHDLLGKATPVWSSSREERHPPVLRPAGGDVIAVVVVLPRATSAAGWSWQEAGADEGSTLNTAGKLKGTKNNEKCYYE